MGTVVGGGTAAEIQVFRVEIGKLKHVVEQVRKDLLA
jgi:hypothetical protein